MAPPFRSRSAAIALAGAALALGAGGRAHGYGQVVGWGPAPPTAIAVSSTCAIVESGAVVCWAGYPGAEVVPPPAEVDGTLGTATAISGTCAIQAGTDAVVCWGDAPAPPPEVDGTLGTATAISGTCAIQAGTGAVVCWGPDDHGQATPPPEVDGTLGSATAISTGGVHACAIQAGSGAVVCWGQHRTFVCLHPDPWFDVCFGDLDEVTAPPTPPPTVDGTLGSATAIAASEGTTCTIRAGSQAVVCWSGLGDPAPPPPSLDGTEGSATAITAAGFGGFCAIQADTESVVCWSTPYAPPAMVDGTLGGATAIDGLCALQAGTNELVCWGANTGQGPLNLAGGAAVALASDDEGVCAIGAEPAQVGGSPVPEGMVDCWHTGSAWPRLKKISGAIWSFCGIRGDGAVSCWDTPPWVDGSEGTATEIAHGGWHDCAIQEGTGAVICWGGTGAGEARPPDSVNGREGSATAIAVGSQHSCAIRAGSGAVVCWGWDGDGQATPPPSVDGTQGTAKAIAARHATTCAIQSGTGAVFCWGSDADEQATPPPTVDGTLGSATAITVGLSRSCAIQAGTGTPVCWGTPDWPLPPSVENAGVATEIAVAGDRTFALFAAVAPEFCPAAPDPACVVAAKGSLKIDERSGDKPKLKVRLQKLGAATQPGDFGDPVQGVTAYSLCIYNQPGLLRGALQVDRAGGDCGASSKPCWKATRKGLKYGDPEGASSGVRKLSTKAGEAGKGGLSVLAANKVSKDQREMPTGIARALAGEGGALLQIRTSDAACFSAELTAVRKADGLQFKAKTN